MSDLLQQLNAEMTAIVGHVRRSLVQIANGRQGAGAGTIWHSEGLIITNAHVVAQHRRGFALSGPTALSVTLAEGRTLPAKLLAMDPTRDLAALAVEAHSLPTISLGDSRQLYPGQWVLALGHPWGVPGAISAGAVIAAGLVPDMPMERGEFVQVGLRMRPGHSGGPLVDEAGRLVGINTMITGPEVGLAVPVHTVKTFLKKAFSA